MKIASAALCASLVATMFMPTAQASQARPQSISVAMVEAHNRVRSVHGLRPVVWSRSLAREAALRASALIRSEIPVLDHRPVVGGKRRGENLWVGTRGAFGFGDMAGMWAAERARFVEGVFPDVSRTGNWVDVGHFTQMIWPATAHIGCAIASNAHFDLLVCRYDPPGNVIGQPVLQPSDVRFDPTFASVAAP